MDLPDAQVLEPSTSSVFVRRPFFGMGVTRDPPKRDQRRDFRIEAMRWPRRGVFEAEGQAAVKVVAATGRGKPLKAQIPKAASA